MIAYEYTLRAPGFFRQNVQSVDSNVLLYYTIIDFNGVDMRIYLPEKVNITLKGR